MIRLERIHFQRRGRPDKLIKLFTKIKPEAVLDIDHISGKSVYLLKAIVSHLGMATENGHYVCHVVSPAGLVEVDDKNVNFACKTERVWENNATMYIYEKDKFILYPSYVKPTVYALSKSITLSNLSSNSPLQFTTKRLLISTYGLKNCNAIDEETLLYINKIVQNTNCCIELCKAIVNALCDKNVKNIYKTGNISYITSYVCEKCKTKHIRQCSINCVLESEKVIELGDNIDFTLAIRNSLNRKISESTNAFVCCEHAICKLEDVTLSYVPDIIIFQSKIYGPSIDLDTSLKVSSIVHSSHLEKCALYDLKCVVLQNNKFSCFEYSKETDDISEHVDGKVKQIPGRSMPISNDTFATLFLVKNKIRTHIPIFQHQGGNEINNLFETSNKNDTISLRLTSDLEHVHNMVIGKIITGNCSVNQKEIETNLIHNRGEFTDSIISAYITILTEEKKGVLLVSSLWFSKYILDGMYAQDGQMLWFVSGNTVIIPINENGNHWIIIIISIPRKRLIYCDSLGQFNKSIVSHLLDYMKFDHHMSGKSVLKITEWSISIMSECSDFKGQDDCFNCGVFVCIWAEAFILKKILPSKSELVRYIGNYRKIIFSRLWAKSPLSTQPKQKGKYTGGIVDFHFVDVIEFITNIMICNKSNKHPCYDRHNQFMKRSGKRLGKQKLGFGLDYFDVDIQNYIQEKLIRNFEKKRQSELIYSVPFYITTVGSASRLNKLLATSHCLFLSYIMDVAVKDSMVFILTRHGFTYPTAESACLATEV
jgi:hypothetical protein